jgi:hypothetical protein
MSVCVLKLASRMLALAGSVILISALEPAASFAACTLPSGATAGTCTYSGSGIGLSITDSNTTGAPGAVRSVATGANGRGMIGNATGKNGIGGLFQALAASSATTSTTALEAVNSGGSTSAEGNYGSAGVFSITNAKNQSPGVSITTNGINSYALKVVNTGIKDDTVAYGPPYDYGGIAGYFEVNSASSIQNQAAVFAVASGGPKTAGTPGAYGNAANFEITNANNNDTAVNIIDAGGGTTLYVENDAGGDGVYSMSFAGIGVSGTSTSGTAVAGNSTNGSGASFTAGSANCNLAHNSAIGWTCSSDRNLKEDFRAVDLRDVLSRLIEMPVFNYRLKQTTDPSVRLLGPMAQDFKAAFGLGENDTTINTGNEMGVALAAIKGLYQELQDRDAKIAAQDAKIAALEERMTKFEAMSAQPKPEQRADATR